MDDIRKEVYNAYSQFMKDDINKIFNNIQEETITQIRNKISVDMKGAANYVYSKLKKIEKTILEDTIKKIQYPTNTSGSIYVNNIRSYYYPNFNGYNDDNYSKYQHYTRENFINEKLFIKGEYIYVCEYLYDNIPPTPNRSCYFVTNYSRIYTMTYDHTQVHECFYDLNFWLPIDYIILINTMKLLLLQWYKTQ